MLRGPRLVLAGILGLGLLELVVLVLTVRWIGLGWTLLALVATSLLGVVVVRRAGTRALAQLGAAVRDGRPPTADLADAGGVVLAGFLLVLPGFVGDLLGAALLARPVRVGARRLLGRVAAGLTLGGWASRPPTRRRPGHTEVVRGEVVDPDEGP